MSDRRAQRNRVRAALGKTVDMTNPGCQPNSLAARPALCDRSPVMRQPGIAPRSKAELPGTSHGRPTTRDKQVTGSTAPRQPAPCPPTAWQPTARQRTDVLAMQRTAGNAATSRALQRAPANVSTSDDVLLEPMPVSPPQVRVLGHYSDEQISTELYGHPGVPIRYPSAESVEIQYSTLLPKWKPAFRASATEWEKNGAEEREKVGHDDDDGNVVWENRLRWTPVTDPSRGGLVVGYERHSGGYTEVRNTAGEVIFEDEIGIESVRIPIVDDVADALKQVGYVAVGVADAWLEDNWRALGLPPHAHPLGSLLGIPPDAIAYRIGRGGGD